MIPLLIFVLLGLLILVLFEIRARKNPAAEQEQQTSSDEECCGEHLVCQRETLKQMNTEIEYYDDEELDALAGIPAQQMTQQQVAQIEEVFSTLQEKDVAGWARSLQMRNIDLPAPVRDEALLIITERRRKKKQ